MSGLEELRNKLVPLCDAEKGFQSGSTIDPSDSYMLSNGRTVNLLSKSYNFYNINEMGLQKCTSSVVSADDGEKTYKCASHEMSIFGSIGSGASSVVQRAFAKEEWFFPMERGVLLTSLAASRVEAK